MKYLVFIFLLFFLSNISNIVSAQVLDNENYIRVDQFGYTPNGYKIAVISKAVNGFNAGYGIDLNIEKKVELCLSSNDSIVYTEFAKAWNNGGTDSYSGDKGWWFDFSTFTDEGEYFVKVFKTNGDSVKSYPFKIASDVYAEVLRVAVNMFYYQRVNQKKTAEYASGENWVDDAWYSRDYQDVNAKYLNDNSITRDISKGWIDAGDPNKYVTFAVPVVHNLLTAYAAYPEFWDTFDLKIPESDNNIPDFLDEIKWEIDWLKNMQDYPGSGGMFIKAGILNDHAYISPPSTDTRNRYFDQICPSASITGSGMMAHAALYFRNHAELFDYSSDLKDRSIAAWNHYENSPDKTLQCDGGEIEAGDADGPGGHYATEHLGEAVCAAVYLFALTGDEKYNTFIKNNYKQTRPWKAGDWAVYRANQAEALLFYTTLSGADETTKNGIISKKLTPEKSSGSNYELIENDNLYRAKAIYSNWGSNSLLARQGNDIMDFIQYDLAISKHETYEARAQSIINYMHGVNPFGMTYLSNMYMYGAELCADEMWHTWFAPDTKYDNINGNNVGPAPGYLSGGFNSQATSNTPVKIGTQSFPNQLTKNQPTQKAFSVDNHWETQPWQFNEPAIYYQAAYVKLLTHFVANQSFQPKTRFSLNTSAENGKVDPENGLFGKNENVVVTAFANPGYRFEKWTGDISDTINPVELKMDTTKIIVAHFVKEDSTTCLIGNAGFENGLQSWINNGGINLTNEAYSGEFALEISTDGGIADDALLDVNNQSFYAFSFYAKKTLDLGWIAVGIDFFDENENKITSQQLNVFTTDYRLEEIKGAVPTRSKFARVWIKKQGDSGSLLIDDLCISFSDIDPNSFLLTVENGTGGGYFLKDELVFISANEPESGKRFKEWIGYTKFIVNRTNATTRIRIPEEDITVTATYEPIVGINDLAFQQENNVKIYPNPTTNFIHVNGLENYNYQLCSLQGESLIRGIDNDKKRLDFSAINAGIYLLKLSQKDIQIIRKLVIQK